MAKPQFNQSEIINALQTNWTGADQGKTLKWVLPTISYSISSGVPDPVSVRGLDIQVGGVSTDEGAGYVNLTPVQKAAAQTSFQLWKDLIALNLLQTEANPKAEITLNYSGITYGNGTYAGFNINEQRSASSSGYSLSTDRIWFYSNDVTNSDAAMVVGKYGQNSMVHEIGHSLGLSHPGPYNYEEGQQPPLSYENNALFANDTRQYSVMSYWGYYDKSANQWTTASPDYNDLSNSIVYCQTPMLYDVLAIQSKYGVNMTTRAGDTVYGFNCNLLAADPEKSIYDFSLNKSPIYTIWDAGGNNTLDCSGYQAAQTISLKAGSYSSVNGMNNNVAIAYNCKIQNAVDGAYGNTLYSGNIAGAYSLKGNAGDDVINGSLDAKGVVTVAMYNATKSAYSITGDEMLCVVTDSVVGRDGSDTLNFVQRLQFTDVTRALDVNKGENAGQAYRLYKAAFDRTPDDSGLTYCINQFDGGAGLTGMAANFLNSPEFANKYGNIDNTAFVGVMYNNVLHRQPNAGEVANSIGLLTNGATRADLLSMFSESPENIAQVAVIIGQGFDYHYMVA